MTGKRIGIIGLGRMGRAMAQRLVAEGFAVSGFTRSGLSGADAAAIGIGTAGSLQDLVAGADILLLALLDDEAVLAVIAQLEKLDLAGRLVVDTSTVSPTTLASRREALAEAGAAALDAPIAGGPEMLLAGTVGLYIGGAAEDFERFRPVAEAMSNRVHHVGPLGQGAAAKLVNNMMLMGLWQTLKEALLLGQAAGIAPEKSLDILSGSPAASPALKTRLPVIRGETDAVGFPVSGAIKDGRLTNRVAGELGVDVPAIAASLASFEAALAAGHGERDLATMVRHAAGLIGDGAPAGDNPARKEENR